MSESNYVWVCVYKCSMCGKTLEAEYPRYNDYGASQFPDVDAPTEVQHKCNASTERGIAELVGLRRIEYVPKSDD